jgi:FAD-dependent urate hydroxylase
MKITIIGGGIGGLTTAIAMRRRGHEVAVYERASELREAGAGITLWPNAMRVLFDLGVGEAIASRGLRLGKAAIRAAGGRVLSETEPDALERRFGAPAIALHRADLLTSLLEALPRDVIHLGATCSGVTADGKRPEAHFTDGANVRSDLVIGADGIHSAVRRHLFPSIQPRYSGYTGWRGVTRHSATAAGETWGRGARFGIVPIGQGRVYWFATRNAPAGTHHTPEENRARLLETFGDWHQPIRDLIATTPAEAILQNDIIDIAPFTTWSRGRVVLLGDAAHPTTPNLGQGACMAIESAAVLAEELDKWDVDTAIEAYVRRRAPRAARITNESWRIGAVGQLEGRLSTALRNAVMRAVPPRVAERRLMEVIGGELLQSPRHA